MVEQEIELLRNEVKAELLNRPELGMKIYKSIGIAYNTFNEFMWGTNKISLITFYKIKKWVLERQVERKADGNGRSI